MDMTNTKKNKLKKLLQNYKHKYIWYDIKVGHTYTYNL